MHFNIYFIRNFLRCLHAPHIYASPDTFLWHVPGIILLLYSPIFTCASMPAASRLPTLALDAPSVSFPVKCEVRSIRATGLCGHRFCCHPIDSEGGQTCSTTPWPERVAGRDARQRNGYPLETPPGTHALAPPTIESPSPS